MSFANSLDQQVSEDGLSLEKFMMNKIKMSTWVTVCSIAANTDVIKPYSNFKATEPGCSELSFSIYQWVSTRCGPK